ncbi:pyridoxamine 5'-phosphate oxidase family protein [Betaproteobacteria bacterium SCN2]|jgi:nitroimidazol reductase NimA-like FMN-containing flavoprotein (pyridoxamine 5'-phosphate oxidase superfamily)|nr:pyridoxamine 5'-phosphate oxidase family protein [Betaproteobacteria bacterium SCN2]
MDKSQEKFILDMLRRHKSMTLATLRPDGFPQATTVTYANEGFELYFCCDTASQKAKNIRKNDKVSAAIDRDPRDWNSTRGISLGGHAQVLKGKREREHALALLAKKFPEMGDVAPDEPGLAFVRVRPSVMSLIDYTQGFGHTELVKLPPA